MFQRIITSGLAFVAIAFTPVYAEDPGSPQDLTKKLAGIWEIEEGVNQGVELSGEELDGTTMVIKGKTIVNYDRDQNETYRATFTLDTSTKPIQIDMIAQMKGVPPANALGILKFDESDEFEICYALPGADRPADFKSPVGSKIMLFECEKED